jgi:hypothetical protein
MTLLSLLRLVVSFHMFISTIYADADTVAERERALDVRVEENKIVKTGFSLRLLQPVLVLLAYSCGTHVVCTWIIILQDPETLVGRRMVCLFFVFVLGEGPE